MSGATITGDGRIALILDVPSMLKRYASRRI
jgi:two-component system chemotaxis sensor kinase CheA